MVITGVHTMPAPRPTWPARARVQSAATLAPVSIVSKHLRHVRKQHVSKGRSSSIIIMTSALTASVATGATKLGMQQRSWAAQWITRWIGQRSSCIPDISGKEGRTAGCSDSRGGSAHAYYRQPASRRYVWHSSIERNPTPAPASSRTEYPPNFLFQLPL